MKTFTFSASWKRPVRDSPAAVVIEAPKPTASEEPKESKRIMFGWCASSARFTSGDHMTPEEMIDSSVSSR